MRVGVVDVGTNSVRLLVTEGDATGLADIERDLVITRLGEGVDRDRKIGPEPLRRTVAAIAGYVENARALHTDVIRIIATSAVRDSANRDDFMVAVKRSTGLAPVLLTGDQEAQLGFLGATLDVSAPPPYLVVDIGGGSTELVRGTAKAERFISVDMGSVRMTERHIHGDPPQHREIEAVARDADAHLDDAARVLGSGTSHTMIGLAGTMTTIVAIALGLERYNRDAIHHSSLARDQVASIRDRLTSMTNAQRRALPAMPSGREDLIVAGIVILERVMDRFGFNDCLVSETDILDGVAIDVMRAPDVLH
jgi:exopolyphosphatase/guanosine-5'-triphosphate,3'-diphosphate pyrophosphatase